jgi:hypothetical protein
MKRRSLIQIPSPPTFMDMSKKEKQKFKMGRLSDNKPNKRIDAKKKKRNRSINDFKRTINDPIFYILSKTKKEKPDEAVKEFSRVTFFFFLADKLMLESSSSSFMFIVFRSFFFFFFLHIYSYITKGPI